MRSINPFFKCVTLFLLVSAGTILAISWEIPPDIEYVWNMDSPSEYIETNMTGSIVNGIYTGRNSGFLNDPYFLLCVNELPDIRINGDKFVVLRARIYLDESIPEQSEIRFYFRKGKKFSNYTFPAYRGWHEYEVDMTAYADWHGTIDAFRLDFVERMRREYEIKIDWIRFTEAKHE